MGIIKALATISICSVAMIPTWARSCTDMTKLVVGEVHEIGNSDPVGLEGSLTSRTNQNVYCEYTFFAPSKRPAYSGWMLIGPYETKDANGAGAGGVWRVPNAHAQIKWSCMLEMDIRSPESRECLSGLRASLH